MCIAKQPTQTDLDFSSHHDKRHKISRAETLLHRAIKLPSTSQGKNAEINHVTDALRVNNYPSYVISNILKRKFSKPTTHAIPKPEELVCMLFKWTAPQKNPNSLAVLPFIDDVMQPLTRILRRHDIQVVMGKGTLKYRLLENHRFLNGPHTSVWEKWIGREKYTRQSNVR